MAEAETRADGVSPPELANLTQEEALAALRELILSEDRARVDVLAAQLQHLKHQVDDKDALIALIAPVMGEALRKQMRDSRAEIIEALYPIIGQLIIRAVSEAMRDLARTVDARMREAFTPRSVMRRIDARAHGITDAELLIRDSMPFRVTEVFLIHRETGLLLWHASGRGETAADSDLVSGMLTAIRDFAAQTLGASDGGGLDEIQFGDRRIIIEAAQLTYAAVVVVGVEPMGFRAGLRERLLAAQAAHWGDLVEYDGDASHFLDADRAFAAILPTADAAEPAPAPARRGFPWVVGLLGTFYTLAGLRYAADESWLYAGACFMGAVVSCVLGWWARRSSDGVDL